MCSTTERAQEPHNADLFNSIAPASHTLKKLSRSLSLFHLKRTSQSLPSQAPKVPSATLSMMYFIAFVLSSRTHANSRITCCSPLGSLLLTMLKSMNSFGCFSRLSAKFSIGPLMSSPRVRSVMAQLEISSFYSSVPRVDFKHNTCHPIDSRHEGPYGVLNCESEVCTCFVASRCSRQL